MVVAQILEVIFGGSSGLTSVRPGAALIDFVNPPKPTSKICATNILRGFVATCSYEQRTNITNTTERFHFLRTNDRPKQQQKRFYERTIWSLVDDRSQLWLFHHITIAFQISRKI